MDDFRRRASKQVGIGGWKCPCCGPRGSKDKRQIRKVARAELKKELRNERCECHITSCEIGRRCPLI